MNGRLSFYWAPTEMWRTTPPKVSEELRGRTSCGLSLFRCLANRAVSSGRLRLLCADKTRRRRVCADGKARRQGQDSHQCLRSHRRADRSFCYAKWREPMLRAGVELYEMRRPPKGSRVERDARHS